VKLTVALAPLLAANLAGCFWVTTKSEGESLRHDVDSLNTRISTKEKALDDQVKQLQQVIDEATKVLKRNNADIGADVDQLRTDVRTANGLATSINNSINDLKTAFDKYQKDNDARLDGLEARLGQLESGKPSANSSPDDLWRLGNQAYEAGRFADAVDIYKRLASSFPTHEKAPNARYFEGQSYTNLKDWDHAIGAYQQLVEKYPQSDLADDGLFLAAQAASQLKNCDEARAYLGIIKQKYPKSNVLKQANDLDRQLAKDEKNKTKCNK
jgi:TolA-binding protein